MRVEDLETPVPVIDLDRVDNNLAKMQAYCDKHRLRLRPHIKTHKMPAFAHQQVERGAIGITCQKLGEAEVLARAGLGPILIANQIAGATKVDRLFAIAARVDTIATVESEFNVQELEGGCARAGRAIDVIIEVDTGMHRCGTDSPAETVTLAKRIARGPLNYRGVMGYEGHAVLLPDREKRETTAREALTILSRHVEALRGAGLPPAIVSAGGTGTYDIAGSWPDVTEVQAGSYVFMDGAYRRVRPDLGMSALTLLTTVIARRGDRVIVDAGMKSSSIKAGCGKCGACSALSTYERGIRQ